MTVEKEITIEGNIFQVTISDNQQALLSAYAKGGAVIGLWNRENKNVSLKPASYVVESLDHIDEEFLERVVRRRQHMPWQIATTNRLIIREFVPKDCYQVLKEPDGGKDSQVFWQEQTLKEYIRCQYEFYEYGIWALVEKQTGKLIGKAGIWNSELSLQKNDTPIEMGYHIFTPYRGQGYGKEASQAILHYAIDYVSDRIYTRIHENNLPSRKLAKKLGFRLLNQTDSGLGSDICLYEWYCT